MELHTPTSPASSSSLNSLKKGKKIPQIKPEEPVVPFSQLYRYSTKLDIFLIIIGSLASIGAGALMPCSILLMGNITNKLGPGASLDSFVDLAKDYCGYFFALASGGFCVSFIGMSSWMFVGERQTLNLRKAYFKAMLKQEIGYFDTVNPNEFATKVANDSQMILMGIGEKVYTCISATSMIITGYVISFIKGWKLSLVMLSTLPVMIIGGALFVFAMQKTNKVQIEAYEKSGGIAEQAIAAIKTVVALGGEEKEVRAYKKALDDSKHKVIVFGFISGVCIGFLIFGIFLTYFLGLWYGAKLIGEQDWNSVMGRPYSFGDVLTILFAMMMGSFGFTGATTPLKSFVNAKRAGARILAIVDRHSSIDVEDPSGEKPKFHGNIEFKDVQFAYPTKPDKQILKGINITARTGQKIAFVGESGCGKTTAMQLIERFYDTDAGEVLFDGVPIKSINIRHLRQNIGYVGQEPALFACSLRENMRFAKKDATDDEIWKALKAVNMDIFIKGLTKQLDTHVGAGGGQLSGGQKQRLAIARAVLKNPTILLLDEATSALDRKNEVEIQATLDEVSLERTTIVIAHRLSTIQNADIILVFDKGVIAERGKHQELLDKKGLYYNLTRHQITQLQSEEKKKQNQEKEEKEIVFKNTGQAEIRIDQAELRIEQPANTKVNEEYTIFVKPKSRDGQIIQQVTVDDSNRTKAFRHPGDKEVDNQSEKEEPPKRKQSVIENIPVQELEALSNQLNTMNLGDLRLPVPLNKGDVSKNSTNPQEKKSVYGLLTIVRRLTRYANGSTKFALYLTYIVPMLNGSALTLVGVILAVMLEIMADPTTPDYTSRANSITRWYLVMGAIVILILTIERGVQAIVAENITTNLRVDVFQKLLRMQMSFFDDPMNSAGALSGRLASDATQVNALLTNAANLVMVGSGALLTGVIMAFVGDWRVALVGMGLLPFLLLGGKFNAEVNKRLSKQQDDAYVDANGYLAEILNNMRTIASFSEEEEFRRIYDLKLAEPAKEFKERSVMSGAAFGYYNFIMSASMGILFVVGAYMMRDHGLGIKGLFLAIMGTINGSNHAGRAMDAIPEAGNAATGAEALFEVLDAKSEIDINDEEGKVTKPIQGNFEFINVSFKYPTRDQLVLKDFNLKIDAGNKIAFVGSSGCGKSTVVGLIMRFYNPISGSILLDGIPIQNYNLKHLRRTLAIVAQEPVLFNGTIEENIRYSREDATDEEVREAARQANALRFIENNEFDDIIPGKNSKNHGTGFQRKVGPKGSQMSGGQKQRIAIARAIIKRPNILLLDEATSALDSQSEAVVQESLDQIMQGKTSIAIAHRISTIRDANEILLFDRGVVAERGSYENLVSAKGMFYKLEKGL